MGKSRLPLRRVSRAFKVGELIVQAMKVSWSDAKWGVRLRARHEVHQLGGVLEMASPGNPSESALAFIQCEKSAGLVEEFGGRDGVGIIGKGRFVLRTMPEIW